MNEKRSAVEQGFYQRCADILGAEHLYQPYPYRRPNRWNNRAPGNGRYPGFGVIHLFGDNVHVQLRTPLAVNRWFKSREAVLDYLTALMQKAPALPV